MTESVAIKAILSHDVTVGASVTVKGWVRSRRTSKGGFAFIHIHDGSCFDTIQAIADEALENYEEINQLGAGCSVVVHGELVESAGRGQDSRDSSTASRGDRISRRPRNLSDQQKTTYLRIFAWCCPSTTSHQYLRCHGTHPSHRCKRRA